MVRDVVDPAQPRCVVLFDTSPSALTPAEFEEAVEVAASIGYAAVLAGHPTRLRTTGGLDLSLDADPAAGRELLDALCEVGQGRRAEETTNLVRGLLPGGWLVLVTGGDAGALRTAGTLRGRFAPFVVFDLSARPGHEVPGVTVIRSDSAVVAVSQWNRLVAR
jgi:uncharacterized protein (DUF58 family)